MANTATNQEREMKVAVERVVGFAQEFGEAHLNLACHAAFPLSLTSDLLYQIWANFVPEAPWTAVARVLLSRLCKQVGSEMYEMDNSVRNLLLRELKVQFGQERFESLGEFLLEYVSQKLTEDDPDTQDLRQAQEWTALAYTKPEQAARELAQVLSDKVQQEDIGEVLRLSSLVETLSEPLVEAGFEPLLVYGQGMKSYVCGNLNLAIKQLEEFWLKKDQLKVPFYHASYYGLTIINHAISKIGWTKLDESWIKTANITLKTLDDFWNQLEIPEDDFIAICQAVGIENWEQVTRPRPRPSNSNDFTVLATQIISAQILVETLQELGMTVLIDAEVRGFSYNRQRVNADIVAFLEGGYDLGWIENSDGKFDLIVDSSIIRKDYIVELINSIHSKYSLNSNLANLKWIKSVGEKINALVIK